ncbi:alpha/beta fold hydrolase [Microlunatus soli]|uniref:Alpha/beta hydrolase family protein n=1 Tax=Microlunatus soli TaxID=630515 RepID=A0A1H1WDY9_9ACTN|nr:alpha/beta fold hydrolase [Microlunatus soli]SDS95507.1 Alpha/beta hydrolase family protein [Microlunatus soli]
MSDTTINLRLAMLRGGFRLLEPIAPGFAARRAASLCVRLPGGAGRRRDDRPAPGKLSTSFLAGRMIRVESWGSGEPVYLMHGWGGWRGQLGAFIEPLVDAGFRVVAFDAPGHGGSVPGTIGEGNGCFGEFVDTLRAVVDDHGRPTAVVAHSFGCAATVAALGDGMPAGRLVLLAPAVDPMTYVGAVASGFGIGPRTIRRTVQRIEQQVGRALTDFDLRTVDPRTLPRTLIITDRQDREMPHRHAIDLAAGWSCSELMITDGLGHQRILRDPDVIVRTVDFVQAARGES